MISVMHRYEMPYYEINISPGSLMYPIQFPRPLAVDGPNVTQADVDALIAAIVKVLRGVNGVTSVKVTRHDETVTDVTPPPCTASA